MANGAGLGTRTARQGLGTRTARQGIWSRRGLLGAAAAAAGLAPGLAQQTASGAPVPLKIGHRAASMRMVGDFGIFQLAREIPGLIGVELQVSAGKPNLRDMDAVRRYKREANRWGIMIPSLAGVWDPGVSIRQTKPALANLMQSIRVAELLGSSVILVAFFKDHAPNMEDEASYGPVVELLRKAAPAASEAGVILGLENSLSPAGNRKLVDLVGQPSVKVYYDLYNMADFGHGAEAIPGVALLGKERICQIHAKNGKVLLSEAGPIDWRTAIEAINAIGYDGWYVFESTHTDRRNVIEATTSNIEFLRRHCRMPAA